MNRPLIIISILLLIGFVCFQFFVGSKASNLVVEGTHELLVKDSSTGLAREAIVFFIFSDYESARNHMRQRIQSFVKIKSETEKIGFGDEWTTSYSPNTEDIAQIESLGIDIKKVRKTIIKTETYNNSIDIKGHSTLEVKLFDGRSLFERDFTLVFMRRTDYWTDWLREFHTSIAIPIRGPGETDNITETELNMVKDVCRVLRCDARLFFPVSKYNPLLDNKLIREVKKIALY